MSSRFGLSHARRALIMLSLVSAAALSGCAVTGGTDYASSDITLLDWHDPYWYQLSMISNNPDRLDAYGLASTYIAFMEKDNLVNEFEASQLQEPFTRKSKDFVRSKVASDIRAPLHVVRLDVAFDDYDDQREAYDFSGASLGMAGFDGRIRVGQNDWTIHHKRKPRFVRADFFWDLFLGEHIEDSGQYFSKFDFKLSEISIEIDPEEAEAVQSSYEQVTQAYMIAEPADVTSGQPSGDQESKDHLIMNHSVICYIVPERGTGRVRMEANPAGGMRERNEDLCRRVANHDSFPDNLKNSNFNDGLNETLGYQTDFDTFFQ